MQHAHRMYSRGRALGVHVSKHVRMYMHNKLVRQLYQVAEGASAIGLLSRASERSCFTAIVLR